MRPTADAGEVLDSFDYVVVLMLENRSFDNLLGYLYPNGVPATAPAGKTFEGVAGRKLANPIPATAVGQSAPPKGTTSIQVSEVLAPTNYHQPYPDPGEEYWHVNTQLFNVIDGNDMPPYNLPNPVPNSADHEQSAQPEPQPLTESTSTSVLGSRSVGTAVEWRWGREQRGWQCSFR